MRRALSGIKVCEVGLGIAGSYCAKLFADLGAEVVKVEPPDGDPLRFDATDSGHAGGGAFLHLNTNKRGITLDPDSADDRARLERLVLRSDLVIEAAGPGDLAGFGLTWTALHEHAPDLSVVSISGFGATGPYADYQWTDFVVQAVSGAMLLQHDPRLVPVRIPASLAQCYVGHMASIGALAAVTAAAEGRGGGFVDCSAVEALAALPSRQAPLLSYFYRGEVPPAAEPPTSTGTLIPTGVFPCADGFVAMMSTPQQLTEMLDVLGDPAAKEAFAHPDAFERPETKEILDVAVYTWLLSHTRAEATRLAQDAGWPLAGVNLIDEVLEADHLHQRNFWTHVEDPAGSLEMLGPWCRFGEGGWALRRPAPHLGEHDAEVAAEVDAGVGGEVAGAVAGEERGEAVERVAPATAEPRRSRPLLEGVRVLDMTVVWSGPYATMLLADLGAEVIRVENPFVLPPTTKGYHPRPLIMNAGFLGSMYGSPAPGRPDRPWNRHAMNNSLARNKLSVSIDTRRPEGLELLMRLAEKSDVFIDNFKANGLARIGIDVSALQRRNPRLIIVRLPPTGLSGDWAHYTGFGAQFDGLTGLLALAGHRNSDLTESPATTYMDGASGPAGAFAVLAALRYRDATGRGQFVEMSQSENVMNHMGDVFLDAQLGLEPLRLGNRDRWQAPQGLYRSADERWLALTVRDERDWRAFAKVLGQPELADDARFADAAGRRAHHDDLDRMIQEWVSTVPVAEAFASLQAAGVPAGPLMDDQMFTSDPQLRAREWFQPLSSGDVGTHLHPGYPFRGVPMAWRRGSPTLGEDNEYVYKTILGVSDEDFARYRDERMLAEDYLKPDGTPY